MQVHEKICNMKQHSEVYNTFWTFENTIETGGTRVPTLDELQNIWRANHDSSELIPLEMYGVCEAPYSQPSAVLSLDLCEIVRETGLSLTAMYSHDRNEFTHDYKAYYGETLLGKQPQMARGKLLPELMTTKNVTPVPYSEAIHAFLKRWRDNGVFILANTSTLEGCEESTIQFLAEHYPSTAHGILFPRNHDGRGITTKAGILDHAIDKLNASSPYDFSSVPTVSIEDAHHHAIDYLSSSKDTHIFMPAYVWNEPLDTTPQVTRVAQQFGTLDTFVAVDEYLLARGIVK